MTTLRVHPCDRPLRGSAPVPSDDRIGVTALVVGALGDGPTRIIHPSRGVDTTAATACLRAMGVVVEETPDACVVHGAGLGGLHAPEEPLDCTSSRVAFHLLAGILAAQRFRTILIGDASVDPRASPRAIGALRARGALLEQAPRTSSVEPRERAWLLGPLPEGRRLGPVEVESPEPDPDLKAAVLLSGLYASAVTRFKEPSVSRDHLRAHARRSWAFRCARWAP